MNEKQRKAAASITSSYFEMVEISKYWRSIFFVQCWCKTLLTRKTVSQAPPTDEHFDFSGCFKMYFEGVTVLFGSLLQYFRFRIRAKIFGPDLGPVRPPPLPTNLRTF